jgi:glycosyltransferase involved in cell wall biosynthesis
MPPAESGVADYSAALLPYLRALGPVELNAPGGVPLYHIGNNALHGQIYHRALAAPGVVVLHDAVLHHFFLGALTAETYRAEFLFNYGEWFAGLAEELWRQRACSGADARYFAYPMIKRIALAARKVIVHNPLAAALVCEHAPNAEIFEIPHLFVPPALPSAAETARFRESLGVGARTLLVAAFGHQRETKRLPVVLRAFDLAVRAGADARLLISGEFVSPTYARAVESLIGPAVLRTGHLPEEEFWRYAAATDLCVNLRYPTAGETSGMGIRLMGIGKPVVFTNDASIGRIPETACLRLDVGAAEEEMLAGYIAWLAREPDAAREIGGRAAAHIASAHAPERAAAAYWDVIKTP